MTLELTEAENTFQRFLHGPFGYQLSVRHYQVAKVENGLRIGDYFVALHGDTIVLHRVASIDTRLRQVTARTDAEEFAFDLEDCVRVVMTGYWSGDRKLSADYGRVMHAQTGEEIEFDGFVLRKLGTDPLKMNAGDNYIAERNSGPQLLTVRNVNVTDGWVNPTERAYNYDTRECIPVEVVDVVE